MKIYFTIAFIFFCSLSYAQKINANWKQELAKELGQLNDCENTPSTGVNPCNKYMVGPLTTVYGINDFYSKELGRHMLVNEISYFLSNSKKWTLLGHGYEQSALSEAQKLANAKKAVVAVYTNEEGIGHMSIILPGELRPSGTWGFQVPNSASFFPNSPQKSYIDKGLSYAFEKSHVKGIRLYARNY